MKIFRRLFRAYLVIAAYFALVFDLGLAISGTVSLAHFGWSQFRSTEVTAEVVRVDEKPGQSFRLFRPVFVTILPSGSRVEYAGEGWFYPKPHEVGDRVLARYNFRTRTIVSDGTRVLTIARGLELFLFGLFISAIGFGLRKWGQRFRTA